MYVSNSAYKGPFFAWPIDSVTLPENISDILHNSHSLFVTLDDETYVADGGKSIIYRFLPNGTYQTIEVLDTANNTCYGLFIDFNETLFCSVMNDHRVWKKSLNSGNDGNWTSIAGTGVAGYSSDQLNNPQGIFVDFRGNLYVADSGNNRVVVYDLNGNNRSAVANSKNRVIDGLNFTTPTGVVLDAESNIYVVDNKGHRIIVTAGNFTLARCIIGCSSTFGAGPSELSQPVGMSFDSEGNIYVTDSRNHRVQRFSLETNGCGK